MPPRIQPKILQLLVKTHKQTIFVQASLTGTVASIKEEVLSALTSHVNQAGDVPSVRSDKEFEVCKAVRDRTSGTVRHEPLDESVDLRSSGVINWETLYLRFRDESGDLLPVEFSQPALTYEEEEEAASMPPPSTTDIKGKRKAPPE